MKCTTHIEQHHPLGTGFTQTLHGQLQPLQRTGNHQLLGTVVIGGHNHLTYVAIVNYVGAVTDHETMPVTLFPNPVSGGQFTLRNESGKSIAVEVHSITGQLVYQAESAEESFSVSTSDWQKGIYLVTVSQDGKRKTFKVVNL